MQDGWVVKPTSHTETVEVPYLDPGTSEDRFVDSAACHTVTI